MSICRRMSGGPSVCGIGHGTYLAGQPLACHLVDLDEWVASFVSCKVTGGSSIVQVDRVMTVIFNVRHLLL